MWLDIVVFDIQYTTRVKKDATRTLNGFDLQQIMVFQLIPMHCNAECNQRDVEIHPEKLCRNLTLKRGIKCLHCHSIVVGYFNSNLHIFVRLEL